MMRKKSILQWYLNGLDGKTLVLIKRVKDYLFTDKPIAHK